MVGVAEDRGERGGPEGELIAAFLDADNRAVDEPEPLA
jgi:hypothetical protein